VRECTGITCKGAVFGAPKAVRDLYISVLDALVKEVEGKVVLTHTSIRPIHQWAQPTHQSDGYNNILI